MRHLLLLTSAALFLGAFSLPIGYYTLLRILVTISAVLIVINEYKGEVGPFQILFGLLAIVFNPLLPVYLHNKSVWTVIDIVTAGIFLAKSFSISSTETP